MEKLYCLLANGEIRDYDESCVEEYGDHLVYVERTKGHGIDAEILHYIKKIVCLEELGK